VFNDLARDDYIEIAARYFLRWILNRACIYVPEAFVLEASHTLNVYVQAPKLL